MERAGTYPSKKYALHDLTCPPSCPHFAAQSAAADRPRPFVVEIASLYDEDERTVIRIHAYGPNDVRNQVREAYPGWFVREASEVAE